MASFFQNGGANTRPERPPHDSPGQRPGFAAIVAIKRCKRATIFLLTRRHSNVVAQASQPAVGQPSFGTQVSKPACRGLPETDANVYASPLATGFLLLFHRKQRRTFVALRYFQWNRATAIRCRGWSRGAHAPSRAAVDASSTAPTRASARGPAWPGTRDFGISPANRRRAGFPTCVPWSSRNGCERGCTPQATGFLLFGHNIPLKTARNRLPSHNLLCICALLPKT